MPRVWTEEQKAAAAETRRRNKEAKSSYEKVFPSEPNYNESKEFGISPAMEAVKSERERAIEEAPVTHTTTMQVTYRPFDGDPHTTIWNGVTFKANVPVRLRNYTPTELKKISDNINSVFSADEFDRGWQKASRHHVIIVPRSRTVMMEGIPRSQFYQEVIPMVELAKRNPSFEVEGFPQAQRIVTAMKVPPAGFEWNGTNRDDVVPQEEVNWPSDIEPGADAVYL